MEQGYFPGDTEQWESFIHHDGFDVVGFKATQDGTFADDDLTALATYTLFSVAHSEWVVYAYLWERIKGNYDRGLSVRCRADVDDSSGKAECQAVIESARLD